MQHKAQHCILMHFSGVYFFILAHIEVTIKAAHLPGRENIAVDASSSVSFCVQVPQLDTESTRIPGELVDLMIHQCPQPGPDC